MKTTQTNDRTELYPDTPECDGFHNQSSCLNHALNVAAKAKAERATLAPIAPQNSFERFTANCDAQTVALAPYRETLAQMLPNLRGEVIEACRIRATVEACEGWSQAVLAALILPEVEAELKAANVPVSAFMAYGDEVVFGPRGGAAVGGARRAAARERLRLESQPTRQSRRAARRKAA